MIIMKIYPYDINKPSIFISDDKLVYIERFPSKQRVPEHARYIYGGRYEVKLVDAVFHLIDGSTIKVTVTADHLEEVEEKFSKNEH